MIRSYFVGEIPFHILVSVKEGLVDPLKKGNPAPKVSIIVLTHNRWNYTKQCLGSLLAASGYPNAEIIVVDNASTDETGQRLAEMRSAGINVIFSPSNVGFACGNTAGCKAATGDILILLNNDTIVPPGWIARLVTPLTRHPELGAVGPMTNHAGNDQRLDHFVGDPVRGADPGWLEDFQKLYKGRMRITESLVFFCVAMKREVFEKVGGLDPAYGIGMFEDDDYCEQVKQAGYRLAVIEDAFVFHHGSASFKQLKEEDYTWLWNRNKSRFEQKWGKTWHPKPADTLFASTDPQAIAQKVHEAGKPSILLLGEPDWTAKKQHWQQLAMLLAGFGDCLVVAHLYKYHGRLISGIRKAGPSFYLTNRIDLFSHAIFDLILYCGETSARSRLRSRSVAVAEACYLHRNEGRLPRVNDADVYREKDPAELAEQIWESLQSASRPDERGPSRPIR